MLCRVVHAKSSAMERNKLSESGRLRLSLHMCSAVGAAVGVAEVTSAWNEEPGTRGGRGQVNEAVVGDEDNADLADSIHWQVREWVGRDYH